MWLGCNEQREGQVAQDLMSHGKDSGFYSVWDGSHGRGLSRRDRRSDVGFNIALTAARRTDWPEEAGSTKRPAVTQEREGSGLASSGAQSGARNWV